MVHFDDILKEINDFGTYQKIRYLLICIAGMLPSIVTYMHSFIAPNPDFRCKNPFDSNDSFLIKNHSFLNLTLNKCNYLILNTTYKCDEWVYDKTFYQTTLTEEWSMVCDKVFKKSTLQTIYFGGYFFGSIVMGTLADIIGRRPIMISGFILIILGSFGSTFGPQKSFSVNQSYTLYAISRFLTAVGTRGVSVVGFVLAMELVGKSKRTFAGMFVEVFFALGQYLLVLLTYFIRDWKTLTMTITIFPCLCFIPFCLFINESPQWLLSKQRNDDAIKILEKIAHKNKRKLNKDLISNFINDNSNIVSKPNQENIFGIMKAPNLLIIILCLYLNWASNSFIFYGIGLKSNDLGLNPYLTFSISATVEVIAYLLTYLIMEKIGRKIPYISFLFICSASLFTFGFVEKKIFRFILAMIGKLCVASSVATMYLYSSELFPTSLRSSLVGSCSMIARIGSMLAPLVLTLGEISSEKLPFIIFSIAALLNALVSFVYPETLNRTMPQNIAQAKKMNAITCCKKKTSN